MGEIGFGGDGEMGADVAGDFAAETTSEMGFDIAQDIDIVPDIAMEPEMDLATDFDVEPDVAMEPEMDLETDFDVEPDVAMEPEMDLKTDFDVEPDVAMEPEMDLETDFDVEPDIAMEPEMGLTEEAEAKGQEEHLRFGELESDQDYEINGFHYETDTVGRVEYVSGKLELGESVRDLQEQGRVGREGVKGDEGGHYIGARFAGSPEGINLFPQDMNLNRGQWKAMENEWDRALQRGAEVETLIHNVYEGDDKRPMGLDVLYTIDGVTHQRSFVNVPRGQLL